MTVNKSGAKASLGGPGREQVLSADDIQLDQDVSLMDETEKLAARDKILKELERRAALGNKDVFECVLDNPEFPEYLGTIQIKRPSCDEERRIGIRTAQYLNGQVGVDVKTENMAIFFATFEICVLWDKAPEWFKPREMPGSAYSVLEFIYGGFAEWLLTFRKFVPREHLAGGEAPAV